MHDPENEYTIISADRPVEKGVLEGNTLRVTSKPALTVDQYEQALAEYEAERERLATIVKRCQKLIPLLTVRQVIEAGNEAIDAAGLNPYCMNEGLATGDERLHTWWLEEWP